VETQMESPGMKEVWIVADSIVSPLGRTSTENYSEVRKQNSGVKIINDPALSSSPIAVAKMSGLNIPSTLTRFESLCCEAIQNVMNDVILPVDKTLLVLSTTKGNVDYHDDSKSSHPHIHLHTSAEFLQKKFGFKKPLVVSNACISGVMAIAVAARFLKQEIYEHALVVGADTLNHFVVSGFQSLAALSDEQCKPFDAERKGINLGEAGAALVLSTNPQILNTKPLVKILGSGFTNDANHISGPSRTGEELTIAIQRALVESNITKEQIDFISAHGTATPYNDEMESKAFSLAGMSNVPINSLKGYFGHTLGAAGVLETIIGVHSLIQNEIVATKGFEKLGVSQKINVAQHMQSKSLKTFLKTASGFGGCNAAMVLQKI
jgi:3-oxoacyl-[acyl-carrier-protein] synthase I